MNTAIKEQKFYKDVGAHIFCIDIMEMNKDSWMDEIRDDWEEISSEDAMLIANPPLTPEQLINQVIAQKQAMIADAALIIAPLRDAQDGGYIKDADKPKLTAWQKYRYELTGVDPAKPVWPAKPE